MTSDAKIGLLLGLVFIFVIAFIINGLPGLHQKDDSNKLTTNMVGLDNNPAGLGANERKVIEETAQPSGENPQPVGNQTAESDARYTMTLPGNQQPAANYTPAGPGTEAANIPLPEAQPAVVAEPVIQNPPATAPIAKPQPAVKPQTAKQSPQNVYVVQDGDTLGLIAKKVYGDQLGNKLSNIEAIFAANRKTLASMDSLQVGQKLAIPTLTTSSASTPSTVLSGDNFKKVDGIGTRNLPASTTPALKPASQVKTANVYVVKEGDSLWRIASSQLGDGNRYKEIVKINSSVLASEDDIEVGMQLKMPAK